MIENNEINEESRLRADLRRAETILDELKAKKFDMNQCKTELSQRNVKHEKSRNAFQIRICEFYIESLLRKLAGLKENEVNK